MFQNQNPLMEKQNYSPQKHPSALQYMKVCNDNMNKNRESFGNQRKLKEGEMLPQISRAYIRVKDEEATVLLVKLYLAKKLGLRTEAGIEILCMGHPLLNGSMKLTYVRDFIWRPRILARSLSAIASGNDGNDPAQYYLMRLSYSLT
ncbi:uncharacterized protein LOC122088197 isoform X2 [Macadamia integrifolia]|uniref:uncharacterized protein LOC122088197 isoform X2 n=1 Tax=Macadamia integrifolia TaxID=60698 RepID=UPI001C4E9979|nr:uncharacterized protein LOC122088197 isoform X2 [Macadamia integrifolia]